MKTNKTLLAVFIFSIAMGFLESSVVVYLRELYYPEGFSFPIKIIQGTVAITEIIREAATLIMLLCIGFIAGKTLLERFAYFIFSFAIWDIFYYVFLKLLLGWPESVFTWDLLFLLPVAWVGPVIAPILCSLAMIFLAILIIFNESNGKKVVIVRYEWILLSLGSLIVIISFTLDYLHFINQYVSLADSLNFAFDDTFRTVISRYIPHAFNWEVFLFGLGIILFVIIRLSKRIKNVKHEISLLTKVSTNRND